MGHTEQVSLQVNIMEKFWSKTFQVTSKHRENCDEIFRNIFGKF